MVLGESVLSDQGDRNRMTCKVVVTVLTEWKVDSVKKRTVGPGIVGFRDRG